MSSEFDMIRVGRKEIWAYVTACISSFNSGNKELIIRGRGEAIAKAVDIVNSLERSFLKGIDVRNIEICSDEFNEGGRKTWKSAIEIRIAPV